MAVVVVTYSDLPDIASGMRVMITDAYGYEHETVALSGVEPGHKFPVVWVERLAGHADAGGRIPWPAESVRPVDEQTGQRS